MNRQVSLEKASAEMIDAALNDKERFLLYGEDFIRKVMRYKLDKKYPKKILLIGILNEKQVLATDAEIEDCVINIHARALNISVRSSEGFSIFEANNLTDLFTCFVPFDKAR